MHHYSHSGLLIASEIVLPEWQAFAVAGDGPADVEIVLADDRSPPFPADGSTSATGPIAGFRIEGVGGWKLDRGRHMTLYPSLVADPAELRLFTLGSAWGLLGYQRGQAMWHGSVVEIGGKAALFCGDAGEGKSTMAASMVAAGSRLVGDDLSRVDTRDGGAIVYPSSSRLKLWPDAVERLGWRSHAIQRDVMREEKYHCAVPWSHAGGADLPLAAVVVLVTGDTHRLDRLSGGEALTEVFRATIYRPEALETMGLWSEQGVLAARIVAGTNVYRLTRPRDLDALDRSVTMMNTMMETLG